MLTTYLRMKKFLETAGAPETGFPSRLKDNIRIKLPFTPDWMGSTFINPLKILLPFDTFAQPIEQFQQNRVTLNGRAERLLQTQLEEGQITQQDFSAAMQHTGALWETAVQQAQNNDDSLKFDAWDFASTMTTPHAPILWALNVARGTPNEIGPLMPMSTTIKDVATMMGAKDWQNSSWNIEGKIRKSLGLPAFNKWDDYYLDRQLSNLAGTGEYSIQEVQTAMVISSQVQQGKMTSEEAMQNPVYAEARYRANVETAGGTAGTLLKLVGIPVHSYPEGERNLRTLQDEFSAAYTAYDEADKKAQEFVKAHPEMDPTEAEDRFYELNQKLVKKAGALNEFFDKHPEYEARLSLWDKPEVRIQKFMVDNVWSLWNDMPTLYKNEAKSQLGTDFQEQFLNSETRNTDNIPVERLAVWMKLMGGDPPGMLKASTNAIGRLTLAPKDIANRVQVFYDMRKQMAPNFYELQNQYYDLPEHSAARRTFLVKNPVLKKYWEWRRDFMERNPDIVPYLSDTPPQPSEYKPAQQAPQFTWNEWKRVLPSATQNLVLDYYQNGLPVPDSAMQQLNLIATSYNVQGGGQALLQLIGQSLR
jgi:hypothetical protein